ncbi:MAG: hypothetical protein Q613_PSC00285G0001, partial [Propionibacterium sp. DORA_15]
PGAVCEEDGRAPDARRLDDLHSAEGEPVRRHPGHLRLVDSVPSGALRHLPTADRRGKVDWSLLHTW